jgi:hypothetical protein
MSLISLIRECSIIASWIVAGIGLLISLTLLIQGNAVGILVFPALLVIGLLNHLVAKITYVGLEILADISTDLRLLRLNSSK